MNTSLWVTNAVISGLKLLSRRKRDFRCFSSADLALSWSNSSEDENFEVERPLYLSGSSAKPRDFNSVERSSDELSDFRNCTVDCRSISVYTRKHVISDMNLVKSILCKHGWNLEDPCHHRVCLDDANVVKGLYDLYEFSSDASLALCFFSWLEQTAGLKHTVASVCTMVYILLCGNMNHRALDLLTCLVREGHFNREQPGFLVEVLKEICTLRSAFGTACSMLAKCYVQEKMLDSAVEVVCKMERHGIFPSMPVYNLLLRSLLQADREEVARSLLEKMQKRNVLNSSIISLFVSYCCRKGTPATGWKLLIEMRSYGIEPDVVSVTIVIDSLCKMSHLQDATLIFFKMVGLGISYDSVSLSCIVDGYCKAGRQGETLRILDLFHVSSNLFLYNSLLSMFCREGDIVQASNTFYQMMELGFVPDCYSYTTMIDGYCKAKDRDSALKYLGMMLKNGIEPSLASYTTLIDSYCGDGEIEIAENLFREMNGKGLVPDVVVYNILINGYGKKGQFRKAFEVLDSMIAVGVAPDTTTYNNLIHNLVMRGFVKEAKDLLEELLRRGFPTDTITFTPIISAFSKRGQFAEALLVWSYISKHNMKPDVVTCSALLNGYCRARLMDEAVVIFNRMIDAGLRPDLILYNTMINGFCSMGNIEDSCRIVDMMVTQAIVPNDVTLRALVRGYERRNVESPVETAAAKLKQILLDNGLEV